MNILDGDKVYPADTIILGPGIYKSENHDGIVVLSTVPGGGYGFPATSYKYPGGDSDTILASHTASDDKTLPAIASALTEVDARLRYWKQLSRLGVFRIIANVITPGSSGSVLTMGFSTDAGTTWNPLSPTGGLVAIDAAGVFKSEWTSVDAIARADAFLTLMMSGGDGTTAPVLARLVLEFAESEVIPVLPPDEPPPDEPTCDIDIFEDTFQDADNTQLDAHAPDLGVGPYWYWSDPDSGEPDGMQIIGNKLVDVVNQTGVHNWAFCSMNTEVPGGFQIGDEISFIFKSLTGDDSFVGFRFLMSHIAGAAHAADDYYFEVVVEAYDPHYILLNGGSSWNEEVSDWHPGEARRVGITIISGTEFQVWTEPAAGGARTIIGPNYLVGGGFNFITSPTDPVNQIGVYCSSFISPGAFEITDLKVHRPCGLLFMETFEDYADTADFMARVAQPDEKWNSSNSAIDDTMAKINTSVLYEGHQTLKLAYNGVLAGDLAHGAEHIWTRTVLRWSPGGFVWNGSQPFLYGGATWDYADKSGFGIALQPFGSSDYEPLIDLYNYQETIDSPAPGMTDSDFQDVAFHSWIQHRYRSGSDYIYELYFDKTLIATFTIAITTEPELMKWLEYHYMIDGAGSGTVDTTDAYIYVGKIEVWDGDVIADPFRVL